MQVQLEHREISKRRYTTFTTESLEQSAMIKHLHAPRSRSECFGQPRGAWKLLQHGCPNSRQTQLTCQHEAGRSGSGDHDIHSHWYPLPSPVFTAERTRSDRAHRTLKVRICPSFPPVARRSERVQQVTRSSSNLTFTGYCGSIWQSPAIALQQTLIRFIENPRYLAQRSPAMRAAAKRRSHAELCRLGQ
jgi:hypothetical protein